MRFVKVCAAAMIIAFAGMVGAQDVDVPDDPDRVLYTPDGEEVRQYLMTVLAVGRRHMTVQFTDGTRHTYRVPDDFRFDIDGTPTPLSGIYPRQRLRAYLYYTGGEWTLAQPEDYSATEAVTVAAVAPRAEEEELEPIREPAPAPMMPRTAGELPLLALIGSMLLLAAGGLRLVRVTRR